MRIAVCIATYKRSEGLCRLLDSLVQQRRVEDSWGIIVVDNDPDRSSKAIVDQFGTESLEIRYVAEPVPGIPAARNRGIAEARSAGAELVAFIDDDEHASPYWLGTMVRRIRVTDAAAISGPVEPLFPDSAPSWAQTTRLYHRSTFPDGASLEYASTANSMLRLDTLAGIAEPFDPAFQYTGGSDSYLFRSLTARGERIIWEPAALVYEDLPASRLHLRWIIARSYRQGITLARCDRLIFRSLIKSTTRAIRGLSQFPSGMFEILWSLRRRDDKWRRGVARIARGAGTFAGLLGVTYQEYRR